MRGCECTDENTHIYGNIGWGEVVKGGWWVIVVIVMGWMGHWLVAV